MVGVGVATGIASVVVVIIFEIVDIFPAESEDLMEM